MFFKNLLVYQLTEKLLMSAESLADSLALMPFKKIGRLDEESSGFVPPVGEELVFPENGKMLVCLQTEKKIIPPAAITKLQNEKIAAFIEEHGRNPIKRERNEMKDNVFFEVLPNALTTIIKTYAYIDLKNGFIVVDAASLIKAEDMLSAIRKCISTLPVTPFDVDVNPSYIMTNWLGTKVPDFFELNDECLLEDEEKGKVKVKNIDLHSSEVTKHINAGRMVTQLALRTEKMEFVLTKDLAFKRVKFLDIDNVEKTENEEQQFAVDFSIMSEEIADLIGKIKECFSAKKP
jgi:recombination associated protein RdgC